MKKIIKRGHIYSLVFLASIVGAVIGWSRYRELPPQVSEVFMAIGAMLILFTVLFVFVYLTYLITSLLFGSLVTIFIKVKERKK